MTRISAGNTAVEDSRVRTETMKLFEVSAESMAGPTLPEAPIMMTVLMEDMIFIASVSRYAVDFERNRMEWEKCITLSKTLGFNG